MTRLIVLVVLAAAAIAVAYVLQRRRPEPPTAPSYRAPSQLDRSEFVAPSSPEAWLLAVFASTTCNSCPVVWRMVEDLARPGVDIERIDVQTDPERHKRYKIDGVPTTLVVDPEGIVTKAFFGPVDPARVEDELPG